MHSSSSWWKHVLSSPHVKLAGAVEMSGVAADSMLSSPHLDVSGG
jgi:hypothetical protein